MRRVLPLAAVAALLLAAPVSAKSYSHPLIEQRFVIRPTGDVDVDDVRAFRFDGDFSFAVLTIVEGGRHGARRVEFQGVWDADSGARLPAQVSTTGDGRSIRWTYTARNETRRFRIRYRLVGVVTRHPDVAQFFWKVIEDKHAPIDRLRVQVVLPGPSPALFKTFVHSQAPPGTMQFGGDRVSFALDGVPGNTFVEARALMEPGLFPALPVDRGETHATILAEERQAAARELEEGRRAERISLVLGLVARFGGLGALVLGAVMAAYYVRAYRRYGREPAVAYEAIYEREPPREVPPGVVPAILTQVAVDNTLIARAFSATLLDLARRGYLEVVEEERPGKLFGLGRREIMRFTLTPKGRQALADPQRLEPIEARVLHVVFREVAEGGETVTTEEIEAWGRAFSGRKSHFLRFVEDWGPALRRWFEDNFFRLDDRTSERAKTRFLVWDVVYGIAAIVLTFVMVPVVVGAEGAGALGLAPAVLGVPAAVVLAVLAAKSLSRRTPEGALEVKRWHNFARFMSDFSAMKDAPATLLQIWDRYLVYAIALGVADRLLQNLKLLAAERGETFAAPAWYVSTHGRGVALADGGAFEGLTNLSRTLENFHNLSRSLSESSSSGGGFSSGGGGGGGGGSSSAG